MMHSVAISWEELLGAFSNMEQDRVYFFDLLSGEIFFVGADLNEGFWEQMEHHQDRFLEIPPLDASIERTLLNGFLDNKTDPQLKKLLDHALSGRPPYANTADILSFFPDDELRLAELRDSFLSNRVKTWLEENDLFSLSTSLNALH